MGHGSHASWPSLPWKVPGLHLRQDGTPRTALIVPIGQGRQEPELLAPVTGWCVPMGHFWQPLLLFSPMVSDHVPGWQSWNTEALLAPTSSQ